MHIGKFTAHGLYAYDLSTELSIRFRERQPTFTSYEAFYGFGELCQKPLLPVGEGMGPLGTVSGVFLVGEDENLPTGAGIGGWTQKQAESLFAFREVWEERDMLSSLECAVCVDS